MDLNGIASSASTQQSQWLNSLRTKQLALTPSLMTSLFSKDSPRNKKKKAIHIYGSSTGEQSVAVVATVRDVSTRPNRTILQEKSTNIPVDRTSKETSNETHNKMLISSIIQPIPEALPAQPIIPVSRDEPEKICRSRSLPRNIPLDAENGILQRINRTIKIPVYEIDSEEGVADSEEEIECITSSQFGLQVKDVSDSQQNNYELTERVLNLQEADLITTELQYVPTDSQLSNPNFQTEDLTGSYGIECNDEYYGSQPAISQTQSHMIISQSVAHEEESLNYREDNSERENLSDYVTDRVDLSNRIEISEGEYYSDDEKEKIQDPENISFVHEAKLNNIPEVLHLPEENKNDEKKINSPDQITQTEDIESNEDSVDPVTVIELPAKSLSVTFSYKKNTTPHQSGDSTIVEKSTKVENSSKKQGTSERIETTVNQKQTHKHKASLADILSRTNQPGVYRRVGLSKRVKVDALHSKIKKK